MIRVEVIPCLSDNYAYLVECTETGDVAIVDPSEADPVLARVRALGKEKNVRSIWSTHHHPDHVGGNLGVLKALGSLAVFGHASDEGRIPGQTRLLEDEEEFEHGHLAVRTLHIPGHTKGAVAYVVSEETAADKPSVVFTGDTLFLSGCGRLFEGTPAMMHASLTKLAALPERTKIYCGHEYTASNLRFAAHVEPKNPAIAERAARVTAMRERREPTVPGTMGEELQTNPFMRVDSSDIRRSLGIAADADGGVALGIIRKAKDDFKS